MTAKKTTKVQDLTGEMRDAARKIWLAGLGAVAVAEKEGTRALRSLVDRGEEFETRNRPKVEQVKERVRHAGGRVKGAWGKVGAEFDERLASALHRMGVPTRDDLKDLNRRIDRLTRSVEKLQPASTRKRAASKGTGRKTAGTRKKAVRKKKTGR